MVLSDIEYRKLSNFYMKMKKKGYRFAEILLLFHESSYLHSKAEALIKELKLEEYLVSHLDQNIPADRMKAREINSRLLNPSSMSTAARLLILEDIKARMFRLEGQAHG
jgi:hypothetical protein